MGRRPVAACGIEVELTPIATTGDRRREAIESIGGQGLFTKEIQLALLDGRIDLAVHSLKDLPTAETPGLCLAAVPERGPAGDALISAGGASLDELPRGATIGTGSPRRRAQLLHVRRDLKMQDIRGNVDTRLRKLREGGYDAVVLAEAGLRRLGLAGQISQRLPLEIVLPAVGQGALALEIRLDDAATRGVCGRTRPSAQSCGCIGRAGLVGSAPGRLHGAGRRPWTGGRRRTDTRRPGRQS